MKNGKMIRGFIVLMTLMLCLWTGGLCFAEDEAQPGFRFFELSAEGEPGEEIAAELKDGKDSYILQPTIGQTYRLIIKAAAPANLQVSKNDAVQDNIKIEKAPDDPDAELISWDFTDEPEKEDPTFWIYVNDTKAQKTVYSIKVNWQKPKETPTPAEGGTIKIDVANKPLPGKDAKTAGSATTSAPAPEIELSGGKMKRTAEDAAEWTIPTDFTEVTLTLKNIPEDKKAAVLVICEGETAAQSSAGDETAEEGGEAGTEAEAKDAEAPVVLQLEDYLKTKTEDGIDTLPHEFVFTVDWSGRPEEEVIAEIQAAKDKEAAEGEEAGATTVEEIPAEGEEAGATTVEEIPAEGGETGEAAEPAAETEATAREDQTTFILHMIEKAQIQLDPGEICADNKNEDLQIAAEVNRNSGTVRLLLNDTELNEFVIPESQRETTEFVIPIKQGTIADEEATLTVHYENESGESTDASVAYRRKWQEIRITEPAGIAYYYATDREKKVRISAEGEPGKQIVISLTHKGDGSWTMENGTYDQLTYGDIGNIANAATDKERSIRLSYEEDSKEDSKGKHSQPEVFEIRTDGEPEAGALVFRMCVPTIQETVFDTTHPTIRIGDAVPGSALVLTMTEPAAQEPITAEIAAGEDGSAVYTREEPFAAGTKIALSEKDHPETVLAETEVVAGDLAEIVTEERNYEITGATAKEAFSIRGIAAPKRAMQAIFEDESQTQVFSTQDFTSDENGNWEVVFAENEKPKEDGIYRVTFIYTGRKNEQQQYVNQKFVRVVIDTQCAFASENKEDGKISIQEGARELKFYSKESDGFEEIRSDGFEEIRVDYLQEGMTNPMPIPASSQDENGEPLKAEKPDADDLITYKLPAQVRKNDRITVYLKDHRGNTEEVAVKILTLPFEHTLTEYSPEDPEGKKADELENLYVSGTKELRIGISGAPGSQVAVECRKSGDDGEAKVLATLSNEKDETKEYTLNRDALETAFKEELTNPGTFTLSLHRIDIEGEEPKQVAEFTYDTECPLEIKKVGEKEYKEDIQLTAGGWFSVNNVEISGTSEPEAEIQYSASNSGPWDPVNANSDGAFKFKVALKSGSDTLVIKATDKAGNPSEKVYEIRITPSSAGPIALLTIGVLLMAGFLVLFFNTQKKIRQLEEINRAKTATVQEKKKKR